MRECDYMNNTIRLLQIVVLGFGLKELWTAMEYYKQKNRAYVFTH